MTTQSAPTLANLAARRRLTVAEFERMIAANIWPEDERIELIDGELINTSPINAPHVYAVTMLTDIFIQTLRRRASVFCQNPVELGEEVRPQPDIALVRPPAARYRTRLAGPADILLVVEVCDTTLAYDRDTKLPLYATANIPEVWLVDVNANTISVYREPRAGAYQQLAAYARGAEVAPGAFPDVKVKMAEVVGDEE